MLLKEIKPGMVIHCKNIAEYKRLEEETIKNGYGELPLHNQSEDFIKKVVFYINDKNTLWGGLKKNYIEFSDLIMPDLTAEEAIEWLGTYYNVESVFIETFGDDYSISGLCSEFTPKGVVEKISKWKSDHERKEPEIETVDICRIIEIQPDGRKRCVHEEYMGNIPIEEGKVRPSDRNIQKRCREILKRYCMEHEGEFIAVHEVVSKVKR